MLIQVLPKVSETLDFGGGDNSHVSAVPTTVQVKETESLGHAILVLDVNCEPEKVRVAIAIHHTHKLAS